MTGRHEGPPLGSAARDATAPPYHGKRRARVDDLVAAMDQVRPAVEAIISPPHVVYPGLLDDPPRCWSCAHTEDMLCECSCCPGDDHGGHPDEV